MEWKNLKEIDLEGAEVESLHRYQTMRGVLGCCNQFRNGDNYFEIVKLGDGRRIRISPAVLSIHRERHYHDTPQWCEV